ncbi:hypothetical protein ZHAS_00016603 [Anopheles sinensis]|uniref:Uncharacterized protein n=1 Tax=Anopheles sinensis TaxID=74873 RepID=A0A084WEH0_ANOSI|nr:hypothetical protein ZHAS_00016603 [Anopheles sinensis]
MSMSMPEPVMAYPITAHVACNASTVHRRRRTDFQGKRGGISQAGAPVLFPSALAVDRELSLPKPVAGGTSKCQITKEPVHFGNSAPENGALKGSTCSNMEETKQKNIVKKNISILALDSTGVENERETSPVLQGWPKIYANEVLRRDRDPRLVPLSDTGGIFG